MLSNGTMYFSHIEISEAEQGSSILRHNDDRNNYTPLVHRWTVEEKIVLCLLAEWYTISWRDRWLIFNAFFRTPESSTLKCKRDAPENGLRTQYWHLRNDKPTNGTREIEWYDTEFSVSSVAWAATRSAMEEIGRELGIEVQKRSSEAIPSRTKTSRYANVARVVKRKREKYYSPSGYGSSDNEDALTYSHVRRRLFVSNQPPSEQGIRGNNRLQTPPPSSEKVAISGLESTTSRLPNIAFRAISSNSQGHESSSGYRAGAFPIATVIPPPPGIRSSLYTENALRHISSVPSGPTPMISVTRNLLRALHHGFKSSLDSFILVIDLQKAERLKANVQDRTCASIQDPISQESAS